MKMKYAGILLSVLMVSWLQEAGAVPRKDLAFPPNAEPISEDPDVGVEDPELKDRINLSFNRGHAAAYGPGGASQSDAISEGVQIGLRRPGQADQSIYDDNRSYGSSNSYGAAPPKTWAGARNQHGYGYNRGGADAGYSGGYGNAQSQSITDHIEIPIGDGTVLFSNLHEKKKHVSKTNPAKKPDLNDRLVMQA